MSNKKRNALTQKAEVNDIIEFDYLTEKEIPFEDFDSKEFLYVVTQEDINRFDLISYKVYRSVYYWWIIAKRNNIIDPYNELYVGMKLYIPNRSEVFSFFNKNKKVSIIK